MPESTPTTWPIEACPHCGRKYRIDPALAGHKMRCRGCDQTFRIRGDGGGKRPLDSLMPGSPGSGPATPPAKPAKPTGGPASPNKPGRTTPKPSKQVSAKSGSAQTDGGEGDVNVLNEILGTLALPPAPAKPSQPQPKRAKPALAPAPSKPASALAKTAKPAPPKPAIPEPDANEDLPLLEEVPRTVVPPAAPARKTAAPPAADAPTVVRTAAPAGRLCPVCQAPVAAGESVISCPGCSAEYHQDCWAYNKGCAVYGCAQSPATEKLEAIEIPAGYWGQENKECPVCGKTILAAAIRCKHCGSIFGSAKPQDRQEFADQSQAQVKIPRARRVITLLLVCSLLPITAPIAAIAGPLWYRANRATVRKLPAVHGALSKIAMGVAIGQTVLLAMIVIAFKLLK